MKPITVLLAEDHVVVREGLRSLLKTQRDIEVVGEAPTGRQAVEIAIRLRPAVVLMDISMPLLNGLEATRQILKHLPQTKVLILSAYNDRGSLEQVIATGATGFVPKQAPPETVFQAIRALANGKTFFPDSPKDAQGHYQTPKEREQAKVPVHLTRRETEVLQLVAEGKANKASAEELGISIKTVEKHRQSLMDKLGLHETAALTRYAISARIIEGKSEQTFA